MYYGVITGGIVIVLVGGWKDIKFKAFVLLWGGGGRVMVVIRFGLEDLLVWWVFVNVYFRVYLVFVDICLSRRGCGLLVYEDVDGMSSRLKVVLVG